MGTNVAQRNQLVRRANALLKQIAGMGASRPLKPVWGGLPQLDSDGQIEPPKFTVEERQIIDLREPLAEFLVDTKRFLTDFGDLDQRQRFDENTLVGVACRNGSPGRRGYSKDHCLADLRSLQHLLQQVDVDSGSQSPPEFGPGETANTGLPKPVGADRLPTGRTAEASVEQHFSVKELSELWGLSERTARRLIEQEPGVIRIHQSSRGKRSYRRVQVPASIAARIYRKITRR
jgi:hypothetical protein